MGNFSRTRQDRPLRRHFDNSILDENLVALLSTTTSSSSRRANDDNRHGRIIKTSRRSNRWLTTATLLLSMIMLLLELSTVTAISLLGGRFETMTDVSDYLNLALDAADMKETDDLTTKKNIYQNGSPRDGGSSPNAITLQSLSLTAEQDMKENPYYFIFKHAFLVLGNTNEHETTGSFDGAPIEVYADTIVNDLFELDITDIETEASLVMIVWMAVANQLFQVLVECRAQDRDSALAALDRAAALWIGAEQVEGSNDLGHLLYNLAENAGERFGQDNGETWVNTQVVGSLLRLQNALLGGQCDDAQGYQQMRDDVKKIIGYMTVPLLQNLIHHTMNVANEGRSDMVELYALGIIPRVAACDPKAYDDELNLDVLRDLTVAKQQEAISAIQKGYSCLQVTCADVGSYMGGALPECTESNSFIRGGHEASSPSAPQYAYMDRDILQIDIFLKFQAYGVALDWYTHGWNSQGRSIRDFAKNAVVPPLTASPDRRYYSLFAEYNNDAEFAHNWVTSILELIPPFNNASAEQVRNSVVGFMKYVVMFVSSADALIYAASTCQSGDSQEVREYLDAGAMLYVGSMEGAASNGNAFGGEFLFSTAKELCSDFNTCIDSNDGSVVTAAVNEVVMTAIQDVAESISSQNCAEAVALVEDTILPAMMIPLVQGTLKYASFNEDLLAGTEDASLSIGDAFSRAILPLVHQASPGNAEVIKSQMQFQLTSDPIESGFAAIADAFRQSIPALNINCEEVGVLVDEPVRSDLCGDGVTGSQPVSSGGAALTAPPASGPTDQTSPEQLAFGRYTFSDPSIAGGDGSFALDVRDMFLASSPDEASNIYKNGKNAITTSFSGDSGLVSLSSLSTQASQFMAEDLMFSIFKYALYDDDDLDGSTGDNFVYADEVVMEALTSGNDSKLAAEASVILNVWMFITHKLYAAVETCVNNVSPEALIDSAVALWIGKDQGEGKFDQGWMLYSIGQSSAKFFGHPEGEAPVNSKLMNLFIEAQTVAKECPSSPNAPIVLRSMVHEIIRTLTKPLITSLLFHMIKNSKNMVELYAVAVVPQVAACSPGARSIMEDALFSGYNQQTSISDKLLDSLATFLQCQRMSCNDIETGENADDNLVELSQSLCSRLNAGTGSQKPMAGYVPEISVTEVARLDLDSLEIYILMRTGASSAATDIYEKGHNSVAAAQFAVDDNEGTDLLSLKSLANSSARNGVPLFESYSTYFGTQNYADDIIVQTLSGTENYATATRSQRAEIVKRTLQTMVSNLAVATKMQSAIQQCKTGATDVARGDWDRAVALYVGSIEGILAGGHEGGRGEWMYALGNEVCDEFGVCETSGEAKVNQQLMFQFASGRDSLVDGECDHIERTMNNEILPRMAIPLLQGLVSNVIALSNGGDKTGVQFAAVHIFSQALTPLLKEVSSNGSLILSQAFASFSSATNPDVSTVVSALQNAIPAMSISCNEIGSPTRYTLCTMPESAGDGTSQGTPTQLAEGLYITTTYVDDRASIALDIRDMAEALKEGNHQLAKLVYRDGKNSQQFDENGKFVKLRSLKQFSIENTNDMFDEPEFNIFMYALQGNRLYADDLVEEALENVSGNSDTAVEACLVLNLWMEIIHSLHKTLNACKQKQLRNEEGVHSMDIAVAYWIGDSQRAGDSTNGHLLYALAESYGEKFGINEGGQSRTNTNILRLFNEAKNEVSLPNACSDSKTTYTKLRRIVNRIIPQMAIPLIQGLILSLRSNDRGRVKIFSHAFVPLVAGCSPSLFQLLKERLLNMNYNVIDVEELINLIRNSYPCLGLQCSDIGFHEAEITQEAPECTDPDVFSSLAGYRPSTDVRELSRLDLDIRQMDILMQMKAFEAAEELYSYGKHVQGQNGASLSLAQLATTSQRSNVPSYDAFVQFYGTESWADDVIRQSMDQAQGGWTDEQRRIVAVKASQVLVTYFGALQNAYEAVSSCSTTQQLRSSASIDGWDRLAAMLIGHLEGSKTNGTVEGYMLYDLSQQYCLEFGTCLDESTIVETNDQLISLLYTGRGAALESSCRALRKAADEISSLLLIPIIQGALSTSIGLSNGEEPRLRAEAFVYSRALLPLIRSREAASTLDTYLGNHGPQNMKVIAMKTFSALATAYPEMGVDCEMIGDPAGFDPCSGVQYGPSRNVWIILGVIVGVLILGCLVWFYIRSRRRVSKLPENQPKFIPSAGELNHSMDLLEKAFSTKNQHLSHSPSSPSTETEALKAYQDDVLSLGDDKDDDFDDMSSLNSKTNDVPDII
ncbi:low iron-inducible periplasmic protein [Nitzschia inconspicua]|uniref:Low iron-inducible periplasmic protein n=1 Tax=Nitzschia inconspicua TaxID=303405 RepID=A0A9K3KTN0_9STRA|nr:low iron-inducible periplasmic protein [Nitzschia inconspicua]